jgi:hypothetical protein
VPQKITQTRAKDHRIMTITIIAFADNGGVTSSHYNSISDATQAIGDLIAGNETVMIHVIPSQQLANE